MIKEGMGWQNESKVYQEGFLDGIKIVYDLYNTLPKHIFEETLVEEIKQRQEIADRFIYKV